nr:hypothetical protein [Mammaliicoccus sp. Marseille-Q6498]
MKKIQAIICSTILLSTLSASPVYAESNQSKITASNYKVDKIKSINNLKSNKKTE